MKTKHQSDRNRHSSRQRRAKKLTAASAIKWLRQHKTWTLFVTVAVTGVLMGSLAIQLAD